MQGYYWLWCLFCYPLSEVSLERRELDLLFSAPLARMSFECRAIRVFRPLSYLSPKLRTTRSLIQSRVTGRVTSITRGVDYGGDKPEENMAGYIFSDSWNNAYGGYVLLCLRVKMLSLFS